MDSKKILKLNFSKLIILSTLLIILLFVNSCQTKEVVGPPKQITKDNITLDAYVPCGKYGELIKYDECENPEQYSVVYYGTTDFDAFLSEQFKKAINESNTKLCANLKNKISCIATIAKKLKNQSICNEAWEHKEECLKDYEEIAILEPFPEWMVLENNVVLLDHDVRSLRVFGYLPEQGYAESLRPDMKKEIDRINEDVRAYNKIIKTGDEKNCFELVFLKTLCVAHIAKLEKQKDVCNILENTSTKCYTIYDNLRLPEYPYYCEAQQDCETKYEQDIIDIDNENCPNYWSWKCEVNKCKWLCG